MIGSANNNSCPGVMSCSVYGPGNYTLSHIRLSSLFNCQSSMMSSIMSALPTNMFWSCIAFTCVAKCLKMFETKNSTKHNMYTSIVRKSGLIHRTSLVVISFHDRYQIFFLWKLVR